jgi:hypothetical protein
MARKKTLEEKVIRARENGYNNNGDNINNFLVLKKVLPCTDNIYSKQMDI